MPDPVTEPGRWAWDDDPAELRRVVDAGGVVAIPSESSYGLAADPRNAEGVEAIYSIKSRERGKPLLVLAADLEQLAPLGVDLDWPPLRRVASLWPAPLTFVVPVTDPRRVPATAGGATLAVRIPAHERLRALLRSVDSAWTGTSANASGEPPILDPRDLAPLLESCPRPTRWIDDGVLPGGPPSTLVAWDEEEKELRVLRPGAFDPSEIPFPETPTQTSPRLRDRPGLERPTTR